MKQVNYTKRISMLFLITFIVLLIIAILHLFIKNWIVLVIIFGILYSACIYAYADLIKEGYFESDEG